MERGRKRFSWVVRYMNLHEALHHSVAWNLNLLCEFCKGVLQRSLYPPYAARLNQQMHEDGKKKRRRSSLLAYKMIQINFFWKKLTFITHSRLVLWTIQNVQRTIRNPANSKTQRIPKKCILNLIYSKQCRSNHANAWKDKRFDVRICEVSRQQFSLLKNDCRERRMRSNQYWTWANRLRKKKHSWSQKNHADK